MNETQTRFPNIASWKDLLMGLIVGVLFGFFLQKGGVAKFEVLIGVLLLECLD